MASDDGIDNPDEADATIWIMPACSSAGKFDTVCSRSFKKSACFPYCMTVRTRGSGSRGLKLYNADDWARSVQSQRRDCGTAFQQSSSLISVFSDNAQYSSSAPAGTLANIDSKDPTGKTIRVQAGTPEHDPESMTCVSADIIISTVGRAVSAVLYQRYELIWLED